MKEIKSKKEIEEIEEKGYKCKGTYKLRPDPDMVVDVSGHEFDFIYVNKFDKTKKQ